MQEELDRLREGEHQRATCTKAGRERPALVHPHEWLRISFAFDLANSACMIHQHAVVVVQSGKTEPRDRSRSLGSTLSLLGAGNILPCPLAPEDHHNALVIEPVKHLRRECPQGHGITPESIHDIPIAQVRKCPQAVYAFQQALFKLPFNPLGVVLPMTCIVQHDKELLNRTGQPLHRQVSPIHES